MKGSANGGNAVTDDLKYTSACTRTWIRGWKLIELRALSVKFARQNSIHVSPTVLFDGLVANEISSGWGEEEWGKFLKAKVAA